MLTQIQRKGSKPKSQRSFDTRQVGLLLLIDLLRNNTGFADPISKKSHDIHGFYVSMHRNARDYKEQVKTYNDSRKLEGKKERKSKSVEMNNFQNPQVRTVVAFFVVLFFG